MKLTISVDVDIQQLDAAATSASAKEALMIRLGNQFSDAARQTVETRPTVAHDKGVAPSSSFSMSRDTWRAEGDG